jgi:hypothetical protein
MTNQNGGIPNNRTFPTDGPTSWAKDHVAIMGIFGIGRDKTYSYLFTGSSALGGMKASGGYGPKG